jgi:hypothetical protein
LKIALYFVVKADSNQVIKGCFYLEIDYNPPVLPGKTFLKRIISKIKLMNMLLSRKANIVIQEFENEVLIYDLKINKAFCLNETSHLVWQLCNGINSIADISRNLSKKLKVNYSEDLVWLALDQLKKNNLLENSSEIEIDFGALSRREVIRKVGLSSVIALPIIASIVAPTAIHAASGVICVNPGGQAPGTQQSYPGVTTGVSCNCQACMPACPGCCVNVFINCDPKCCSGMAVDALDNGSMSLCFC